MEICLSPKFVEDSELVTVERGVNIVWDLHGYNRASMISITLLSQIMHTA